MSKTKTKPGLSWVSLDTLARAWVHGELAKREHARFEKALANRLKTSSFESAVWGALRDVGLGGHARHLQDLIGLQPTRVEKDRVHVNLAGAPKKVPAALASNRLAPKPSKAKPQKKKPANRKR